MKELTKQKHDDLFKGTLQIWADGGDIVPNSQPDW